MVAGDFLSGPPENLSAGQEDEVRDDRVDAGLWELRSGGLLRFTVSGRGG